MHLNYLVIAEQMEHQRGRIITHASHSQPGMEQQLLVKQEHGCVVDVVVGKFCLFA